MALYKRIEKSTIAKYFKGVVDSIAENKPEWAMLKAKGKIRRGVAGKQLVWNIRGGKYSIDGRNDFEQVNYTRKNHLEQATLDWAEYIVNDAVSDGEKLMNRGNEAMTDEVTGKIERMRADMVEGLAAKFVTEDVNDTTLSYNPLAGIASWKSGSYSSGKEATPNDSFAGLSTAPSAATAIDSADQLDDFWSPLILNADAAEWDGTSATFGDNILAAMRYAKVHRSFGQGKAKNLDCFLLSQDDYLNYLQLVEAKEEIQVQGKAGPLADLGFQTHNFYGCEVTWSENVSANEAYGLNYDHCELNILGPDDFDVVTDYSSDRLGDVYAVVFRGQIKWNPRYQVVIDDL